MMTAGKSTRHARRLQGLTLLHEDRDILVVDKAPGLLTIGTDKEKTKTAYYRLTDYVRKGNAKSRHRIFIVHRLDREVSGILVFAKTPEAKERLQRQWDQTEKKYLAVVHGCPKEASGTISSYLAENSALVAYSTKNPKKGKLSHTQYRVLQGTAAFSLLEITLLTGRKNQIRVHLADVGHPIVGDQKYGEKDKVHKRIALHALSIAFRHPFSGEQVYFESDVPTYFKSLIGATDK